ncbi:hypothetical protein GCM10017667_01990 [Streptomyces filamentosus]|uniref:Uncharacterized protein n=1 Tax=Streptomyces filamentosus TaxID=67294 RepID=A0A919BAS1_STRFL|nr:hypothetical protein GCM10017667_01990 [Streptomyces filamentosus]
MVAPQGDGDVVARFEAFEERPFTTHVYLLGKPRCLVQAEGELLMLRFVPDDDSGHAGLAGMETACVRRGSGIGAGLGLEVLALVRHCLGYRGQAEGHDGEGGKAQEGGDGSPRPVPEGSSARAHGEVLWPENPGCVRLLMAV